MGKIISNKQDKLAVASEDWIKIFALVAAIGAVLGSINQLKNALKAFR